MSRIVKLCLVLFVLFLGLVFHLKNNQLVEIHYYVGNSELPLSLMLVLAICLGAVLGIMASIPLLLKLKQDNLRLNKQVKTNVQEINNLRVMPLKDTH